jgi:uncharacterized protein
MDSKFQPAMQAIRSGDVERLAAILRHQPELAIARSSCSHPTLLQCSVLDAKELPANVRLAELLVEAGAEVNEPLIACASCDNRAAATLLLDRGAAVDGTGPWSPLEEALYWNSRNVINLLLERGASIHNLRIAAGLGRTDLIPTFFDADNGLKLEAGAIHSPFSNRRWTSDRQRVVDNAFVYACMHGHIDAAKLLIAKGAEVNAIPAGFDYAGSGLHYAALNGHRATVEFLIERGADLAIRDSKVGTTPDHWADFGGHKDIGDALRSRRG